MRRARGLRKSRGQSLVEFALIVPILMTLAMTIAEFGVAFGTNMTIMQATKEGARVGAVLGDGSSPLGSCTGLAGAASVDPQIIGAVQRAIESSGSGIVLANVDWIKIYKYGNSASENTWTPGDGGTKCGVTMHFIEGSHPWLPSDRTTSPAVSIGVKIQYHYRLFTPLAAISGMIGFSEILMTDSTVMAIEP